MEQALALQAACDHCGIVFYPTTPSRFCCRGCEFVFGLIHAEGLDFYYKLRDANPPACPLPAATSTATYDFCDEPEFQKTLSPDGIRARFYLEGLNCVACLWLLEKLPTFCSDAESARINMSDSTIEVCRHPGGSFAAIAQALNRFGYRPHPLRDNETSAHLRDRERRKDLIRIGVAGAVTGNIMILAVSLYAGATGELAAQFRWLSGLLALPVLTYCAWPFYRSALLSLKGKRLNIDVPIVAAILAAAIVSVWGLVGSIDVVYFDSISMLVFLLLSSRFLLKGIQGRQLQATNLEDELLLATVRRLNNPDDLDCQATATPVSSLSLAKGDRIVISEGLVIPVDGKVITGNGSLNIAVLTGESDPVEVSHGLRVEAGSLNVSGEWILEVENPPRQTRLAQILRDTEKSARDKSAFVRFADRISQVFIGVVFFAALVLVVWFAGFKGHPAEGITRALALIIVTCPCVFGIAIPLSMSFAIREAARLGIIIKSPDTIERLWKVRTLFFDKTGTLTTGVMAVLKTEFAHPNDVDNDLALSVALGIEANQLHPVAKAIARSLSERGIVAAPIADTARVIHCDFGGGIAGEFNGVHYSIQPLKQISNDVHVSTAGMRSAFGLYRETKLIVTFHMSDEAKQESAALLNWARAHQFAIRLLSGDRQHVVAKCAETLGFKEGEFRAEVSPEIKAATIRDCTNGTAMIGDGINDAAGLAAADVGIAVCGSLDVSLRAADVYLTRPNLSGISDLFFIARSTQSAIRRNLIFSASFNIVSGILAVSGFMNPLSAAVLMPMSSLIVLISATFTGKRLRTGGQIT